MMQALISKALSVPKLSWPLCYSLTAVFVVIALAIRLLVIDPMIDTHFHYPFLLFYPAIISASLIFDHGTMVFSTLLSAFLAMFLFIEPRYSFTIATSSDLLGLGGLGQFRRRCGLVRQIALTAFLLGATVIEFHYVLCAAARSGCSVAG